MHARRDTLETAISDLIATAYRLAVDLHDGNHDHAAERLRCEVGDRHHLDTAREARERALESSL